ncbi:unnamed protein product [Periconia digitata]|uniref:Uncharacterized protein n=1 Tax=Periconia digitata TaxID=1303443 RepID=A0A9W4UPC4_9PLEO|nr:unnamed protein product [Periconia digitata]
MLLPSVAENSSLAPSDLYGIPPDIASIHPSLTSPHHQSSSTATHLESPPPVEVCPVERELALLPEPANEQIDRHQHLDNVPHLPPVVPLGPLDLFFLVEKHDADIPEPVARRLPSRQSRLAVQFQQPLHHLFARLPHLPGRPREQDCYRFNPASLLQKEQQVQNLFDSADAARSFHVLLVRQPLPELLHFVHLDVSQLRHHKSRVVVPSHHQHRRVMPIRRAALSSPVRIAQHRPASSLFVFAVALYFGTSSNQYRSALVPFCLSYSVAPSQSNCLRLFFCFRAIRVCRDGDSIIIALVLVFCESVSRARALCTSLHILILIISDIYLPLNALRYHTPLRQTRPSRSSSLLTLSSIPTNARYTRHACRVNPPNAILASQSWISRCSFSRSRCVSFMARFMALTSSTAPDETMCCSCWTCD